MGHTQRKIAAKIAALVRRRNAINQEIHYWRGRQKPNTEPNTEPNTKERNEERSPTPPKEEKKERSHTHRAREVFITPTLSDCMAYASAMRMAIDVEHFHDHFTSNGWKVSGRTPMKDWKAAMRNWARRDKTMRPLASHERRIAEGERMNEAAQSQRAKMLGNALAALTERDWALCAESCANCTGRSCAKGHRLPCDHRLTQRPVPPADCPHFSAKGGAA